MTSQPRHTAAHPCPTAYSRRGGGSGRRRGSIYILALGTALALTVIGLSTLLSVRIERRGGDGACHLTAARFYAQSAVEYGFVRINEDADWRQQLGNGLWASNQAIGEGTFSLDVVFIDDGDENEENDAVVLTGTGVSGPATHRTQVMLVAQSGSMVVAPGSWKHAVN